MQPQFQDEEPVNPFDFWEGASFKLKIRNVEGYRNYDKSEFASPAPLSNDDDELEAIYNQLYDLNEFTDPSNYKTYDELKLVFRWFLARVNRTGVTREVNPAPEREPAPMRSTPAPEPRSISTDDDEEDTMSFFSKR